VRRTLRRAVAAATIVLVAIAIVLVESRLVARAPVLFDERTPEATAKTAPGPVAALASDAMPVAVLH
jgi:hypothetical protein